MYTAPKGLAEGRKGWILHLQKDLRSGLKAFVANLQTLSYLAWNGAKAIGDLARTDSPSVPPVPTLYSFQKQGPSSPTTETEPEAKLPWSILCLLEGSPREERWCVWGRGIGGKPGPGRGGLSQQDDREMIKPTEKIDKGAEQLQLCKVGWGQISSCPGSFQSTGGLGQPG